MICLFPSPLLVRAKGCFHSALTAPSRNQGHPARTSLPAFITPNILDVLVKNFGIKPIAATPEADLEEILGPCWSKTKAECVKANLVDALVLPLIHVPGRPVHPFCLVFLRAMYLIAGATEQAATSHRVIFE